jgi:hypothetical protein
MSKKLVLSVLIGTTLIISISQNAFSAGPNCTPGYCIDISIDLVKGTINPVPDIHVPRGSKDIHIHWRLPAGQDRHSFRQDHIKLKNPKDNDDNAFDQQSPNDPRTYHWHNKNPKKKDYYYEINVYDAKTNKVITLDPVIHNDG